MNSQNPEHDTQDLIERICTQGCTTTRQYIEQLINHEKKLSTSLPDLLKQTSKIQQKEILDELITIMAVYDNKDCDQNP